MDNKTNIGQQNTTQKTKDLTTRTILNTTGETRCLVEWTVSTPDVAPDELFFNDTKIIWYGNKYKCQV